ncbi:LysM peptidoglycan-binding domain-containing protein [Rhodobacteraceae bacterium RKSG542]|uniref:Ig-like domain-containing protein n=1 Tax=Pseudovibrio flavus TaxID=2529854 RepID=UPI0012BCFC7D|nr:Ig-like domain-containing protein [Pseudovibrio flavus]MTI16725.1 LysM peptidoglycan-binding domain-containing protein [Pseudovibrio flavus]
MSKLGLSWLLAAVIVAGGVIGGAFYYFNSKEAPVLAKPDNVGEKLATAVKGNASLGSGNSSSAKTSKDVSSTEIDVTNAGEVVPSFDVMRVEPTGDAVIAGRSEAGAIVAIVSNGDVIGKGIANKQGEFAIVLEEPMKPGNHDVTLEATDADTKETVKSEQSIAVSIPEKEEKDGEVLVVLNTPNEPSKVLQLPDAPELAAQAMKEDAKKDVAAAAPTTAVEPEAVAEASAPEEPVTAAAEPQTAEDNAKAQLASKLKEKAAEQTKVAAVTPAEQTQPVAQAEPELRVEAVESEEGKVFVAGEGEPGSKVRVYVGDELVGEAQTTNKGRWLVEADKEIPEGEVAVRADQVANAEGKVEARAQVTFAKEKDVVVLRPVVVAATGEASGTAGGVVATGVKELPNVIIRRGDNLWTISRRIYGDGMRYSTIYQANDSQIRDPDLIYPGQVFVLPKGDLNWKTN